MTLVDEYHQPGNYSVNIDGTHFASGIYFYEITAGSFRDTKKLVLMR
jgi:hypothetical protein